MSEKSKEEKYDPSILPGVDEDWIREDQRREFDKSFRRMAKDVVGTMFSLDNAEILYCLYRASEHTTEKITPERLIELAGLWSPPYSLEKVKLELDHLRGMAFIKKEDEAYSLTGVGLITIRFLDSYLETVVNYDILKERLPEEIRKIYDGIPLETRKEYTKLYSKFRKIDDTLKKGI